MKQAKIRLTKNILAHTVNDPMDSRSHIGIPMYISKDNPKKLFTVIAPMNSTIGPYIGTPIGTPMGTQVGISRTSTSNLNSFQSMKTMNDVLFNDILKK